MNFLTSRFLQLLVFGFWVVAGTLILWKTPYRGEHWALFYAYEHSVTWWDKLRAISGFECFANVRFQPLTFFASLLPYQLFGYFLPGQYVLTFSLHVLLSLLFLKTLSKILNRSPETLYLEGFIFLFSYFAADVLAWSFYVYLQLACLLGFGAYYWLLYRPGLVVPLFAMVIASALYEPLVFLFPFAIYHARHAKARCFLAVAFGLVLTAILYRYQLHLLSVEKYSSGELPPILAWSFIQKVVAALIKLGLQVILMFCHLLYPIGSVTNSIFELKIPETLREFPLLFSVLGWVILFCFFLGSKRKEWVGIWLVLFLSIAWARTENSSYAVQQYRYAYVVLMPFFLLIFSVRELPKFLLIAVMVLHLTLSLQHFTKVRDQMEIFSNRISELKRDGRDRKAVTDAINAAVISGEGGSPFLQNARSCSLQWRQWLLN